MDHWSGGNLFISRIRNSKASVADCNFVEGGREQEKDSEKITVVLASFLLAILFVFRRLQRKAQEKAFTSDYYRLMDTADLLSDSEEATLLRALDEVSERQKMDVVIVTAETLDGSDIVSFADDLYDYCQFGYGTNRDGLLLLISMEDRDWYISTCGYGITAFTDAGIQYIGRQMKR